jgi:hypothetical protein
MSNPNPKNQFVKGDPRIWRKGRPRSFDALRELAQQIAHEVVPGKEGPAVINILNAKGEETAHILTASEYILRQWAMSKNPQLQRAFIEIAFGKVPQAVEVSGVGGEPIQFVIQGADPNKL